MKKTLQNLLNTYPDKIEEVSDESRSGDGYWLYLKPGWKRERCDEVHSVHEWTMRELVPAMRRVVPCDCADCRKRLSETTVVAPEDRGMTTEEFEAHHGRKVELDDILASWRRLPSSKKRGG